MLLKKRRFLSILCLSLLAGTTLTAQAQSTGQNGYDDYGSFATDPVDLDNEYTEVFGRFFQLNLHLGTGIMTGGLGSAYSAGVLFGSRFIFYFDKRFGAELSISYAKHPGLYNQDNTTKAGVDIQQTATLVPFGLALRYTFDQDALPRGFSSMNPFLVGGAELMFRSESVDGVPTTSGLSSGLQSKYVTGAVLNSTAMGVNFGGGVEFDVYRKKVYLGVDIRYHLLFWSDADTLIGTLDRRGNYISVLGTASYSY